MPSYKVLKGLAHNFGHSFTSLMNFEDGRHIIDWLEDVVRDTGETDLTIDFVAGKIEPGVFRTPPIEESVALYSKWFWDLTVSHGATPEMIRSVRLRMRYRPNEAYTSPETGWSCLPYACTVELIDDGGRVHVVRVKEWWRS